MKEKSFKTIINQGLAGLFHICAHELKNVFKDQGVLIFFILVPLLYPLLYAFIYTDEVVREVPAAVVDHSKSSISRKYLRLIDATPDVHIQSYCADMEEAKELVKEGRVYGIIYIPEDFSKELAAGKQAHVSLFCDMSGMLYYKALLMSATNASLEINRQIKIVRLGNTTERQDEISTAPHHLRACLPVQPTGWIRQLPDTCRADTDYPADPASGYRHGRRYRPRKEPVRRPDTGKPPLPGHPAHRIGKITRLPPDIRHHLGLYTLCGTEDVQPGTDCSGRYVAGIRPPIPAGLHLLLDDLLHLHPSPGIVHDDLCVHFASAAVHFRHFVAGSKHTGLLESLFLDFPLYVRYQRVRAYQQHGSYPVGCTDGIPCLMATGRYLFCHDLSGIPVSDSPEPQTCHR